MAWLMERERAAIAAAPMLPRFRASALGEFTQEQRNRRLQIVPARDQSSHCHWEREMMGAQPATLQFVAWES